jgi:hypothetical protein
VIFHFLGSFTSHLSSQRNNFPFQSLYICIPQK